MRKFLCIVWLIALISTSLKAQEYQLGDVVVNGDDGSRGVVFWLSSDKSHGWMVALNDLPRKYKWGPLTQIVSLPDVFHASVAQQYLLGQKDTAGYNNTRILREELPDEIQPYAAKAVDFEKGWFLPSSGQLSILFSSMPWICDVILNEGGSLMEENYYWASTENTDKKAWLVSQSSGIETILGKENSSSVRAIRMFQNKVLKQDSSLHVRWNTNDTTRRIFAKPTQSEEYSVVATTLMGCQAKALETVLVSSPQPQEIFDTLCQGEAYNNNGFRIPKTQIQQPGDYRFDSVLENKVDCKLQVFLFLHVKPKIETRIDTTFCKGKTFGINGKVYVEGGEYTLQYSSFNGCDSTLVLRLSELESVHKNIHKTDTNISFWVDQHYYSSGSYTRYYTAQNGCDSTETLHLNLIEYYPENPIDSIYDTARVCSSELPYTYQGKSFAVPGNYPMYVDDTTLLFFEFIVKNVSNETVEYTQCKQITYQGEVYTQDTNLYLRYTNVEGCDSFCVVKLKVLRESFLDIFREDCQQIVYEGEIYTRDTTFVKILVNAAGCDSVLTHAFTVYGKDYTLVQIDSLEEIVYNGKLYKKDTTFYEKYTNQRGCDSLVEVRLRVQTRYPECEIVVYWGKVLALSNPNNHESLKTAHYEWTHNNQVLSGNRDYIEVGKPIPEGIYQVIATWEGGQLKRERTFEKSAISSCSPNPLRMSEVLVLKKGGQRIKKVEVFDTKGQTQYLQIKEHEGAWEISAWKKPGFYILRIDLHDDTVELHKIIVTP